jgi:outer membrane lipoprotein-sorting protein
MKKILRFGLPVLAVVLFINSAASAQGVLNEILKRMDAQNKSLTSLRAGVTMVKENAQLGDTETTQGKVLYLPQRSGNPFVRIDWVKPDESLAVVNKQYVIYRPRLGQAYTGTTDTATGNAKAGGALAFLNMSKTQLKANYDVQYLGEATLSNGAKTWHLQMTPKTAASYKSAEVWVDKDGFPVQSRIVEANKDATTVLLSNLEKNVTINAAVFKIELPKGTKIIKG